MEAGERRRGDGREEGETGEEEGDGREIWGGREKTKRRGRWREEGERRKVDGREEAETGEREMKKNWPGRPKISLKYDMFSAVGSFALCNGWDETSHNVCENCSHPNNILYIRVFGGGSHKGVVKKICNFS